MRLSFRNRNRPSGLSPRSTAPTPAVAETVVLPSSVSSLKGLLERRVRHRTAYAALVAERTRGDPPPSAIRYPGRRPFRHSA